MVTEDIELTDALRTALRERIGPPRFDVWFSAAAFKWTSGNSLSIESPTCLLRDWLIGEFGKEVKGIVGELYSGNIEVRFDVAASSADDSVEKSTTKQRSLPLLEAESLSTEKSPSEDSKPSHPVTEELSFMSFVEGPSNRAAFRATQACASRGQVAPLVLLWGPHGVGKTHLLRAARAEFRQRNRRGRVLYLTAEQFTTGFIEAIHGKGLPTFRQKHRGVDLLLLDDVHFLAGKPATLEEFQYSLDTLAASGGQAVIASNRGPASLFELGPEITSRLAAGISCQMHWPELDVRLGILRSLSKRQQSELPDEVLDTLAAGISLGARELAGALNRLRVLHEILQEPLDRSLAERVVTEINHQCTRPVQLGDIQKAVCDVFGLEAKKLKSNQRSKAVSEPRMLAMWLARKYTRAAWSEIGDYFGRRSHSTVISAHRRVEKLLSGKSRIHTSAGDCEIEEALRRVENVLRSA